MTRILITGATGLLGSSLVRYAYQEHEVLGVARRSWLNLPGVRFDNLDLTEPGAVETLIREFQPELVVNTAALTDIDRCEQEPELAYQVNCGLAETIAQASANAGARLAHISTDAVFDGTQGPYHEQDLPDPLNIYGKSKLEGELAVLRAYPQALVLRTNFFGWNVQPKQNLAEWFLDCLLNGRPCPGFTDVQFNPLYALELSRLTLELLGIEFGGLLNLAGGECLSKYEFGCRLAEAFGLDVSLIHAESVEQANMTAPRAHRLCLDVGLAEEILERPMPSLADSIAAFKVDREASQALKQALVIPDAERNMGRGAGRG